MNVHRKIHQRRLGNGRDYATLEEVLMRLDRLEMVAGVMATQINSAWIDPRVSDALGLFAATITAERKARDMHLPEPEL